MDSREGFHAPTVAVSARGTTMLTSHAAPIVLAAVLALTLLAAASHRTVPRAAAAGDCTIDATMDSEERAFLVLINNYRAQNGLGALEASYMLTKASAWKSKDLATNNYFAHDDLSRTWSQRIRDCGYGFNTWLGENIAAGYTTAQQVFDGWKASPGHNANMLGANYTAIGIGRYFVQGSTYGWYWTTDFGGFSDGWATVADTVAPTTDTGLRPATGAPPARASVQPPPLAPPTTMFEQPRPARRRATPSLPGLARNWRRH
jgi:uncharacterized protein YkwD